LSRKICTLLLVLVLAVPTASWSGGLTHTWSQSFGDPQLDLAQWVAVGPSDRLLNMGVFRGDIDLGGSVLTSTGAYDVYVAKFDTDGNHLWSLNFGGVGDDAAYVASFDPSGNVLVTGYTNGGIDFGEGPLPHGGGGDVFLVKFDPNGNHLWSQSFGGAYNQTGNAIAADADGDVIVLGSFQGTIDFGCGAHTSRSSYSVFLVKFDPDGNCVWSHSYGDDNRQAPTALTIDAWGNILATGYYQGTLDFGGEPMTATYPEDVFLVKLAPDGTHVWSRQFGGPGDQQTRHGSVTTDPAGNVILTGANAGTTDYGGGPRQSSGSNDVVVVKLDTDGNHIWSRQFGDGDNQIGYGVALDCAANVIVSGLFRGSIDFGGGPLISNGSKDIFIAKFDGDGNHLASYGYGSTAGSEEGAFSVAANDDGDVFLAAAIEGNVDFGGTPLPYAGGIDAAIVKFHSENCVVDVAVDVKPGSCPNPMNVKCTEPAKGAKMKKGGVLPVAIAGTADLDVYDIDPSTLALSGVPPLRWSWEDVTAPVWDEEPCACTATEADGWTDLALKFDAQEVGGRLGDVAVGDVVVLELSGALLDGTPIEGHDCVVMVGKHGPGGEPEGASGSVRLQPGSPNPFNPVTTIRFELPEETRVHVAVYDVAGHRVATLVNGVRSRGTHAETWNAGGLASGVYYCRLVAGEEVRVRRLVLLK
jgi:hypothetical protein